MMTPCLAYLGGFAWDRTQELRHTEWEMKKVQPSRQIDCQVLAGRLQRGNGRVAVSLGVYVLGACEHAQMAWFACVG